MKKMKIVCLLMLFTFSEVDKGEKISFNPEAIGRVVLDNSYCSGFVFEVEEMKCQTEKFYKNFVATAGHCVTRGSQEAVFVSRLPYPLHLVGFSLEKEVGIYYFLSHQPSPVIKLNSRYRPISGEKVWVAGYGSGWEGLRIKTFKFLIGDGVMVFEGKIYPGSSGSPVLNSQGEAIALVWGVSKKNIFWEFWESLTGVGKTYFYASSVSSLLEIKKGGEGK